MNKVKREYKGQTNKERGMEKKDIKNLEDFQRGQNILFNFGKEP